MQTEPINKITNEKKDKALQVNFSILFEDMYCVLKQNNSDFF